MALLFLFLALTLPFVVLTAIGRVFPSAWMRPATRAKVGVTVLFLITASGHFFQTAAMSEMLPPQVPLRIGIILVTGVFELMGAIGIWVPAAARLTGALLIAMLVGVLPSNIYSAFNYVPFGGHDAGPIYLLVRVPFQILLIGWVYRATGQRWGEAVRRLRGRPAPAPLG